jgi:hypothetical protein
VVITGKPVNDFRADNRDIGICCFAAKQTGATVMKKMKELAGRVFIPLVSGLSVAVVLYHPALLFASGFSVLHQALRIAAGILAGIMFDVFMHAVCRSCVRSPVNPAGKNKEKTGGFRLWYQCACVLGLKIFGSGMIGFFFWGIVITGLGWDIPVPESILPARRLPAVFGAGLLLMLFAGFIFGNFIFFLFAVLAKKGHKTNENK